MTEQDRDQVLRQMERLLETTHFRNSRRYPALFRFIVEETLAGRGEFLKERLLGVQVFGRPTDYDTAADPVVRVTVAEIRKRIAQYYHDENHTHELRIELFPGRYEPEFRVSRDARQPAFATQEPFSAVGSALSLDRPQTAMEPTSTPALPIPATPQATTPARRSRFLRWALAGGLTVVIAIALSAWALLRPTALDRFWNPVLSGHQPIFFCIPVAGGKYGAAASSKIVLPSQETGAGGRQSAVSSGSYLELESLGENVVFSDVRAMISISDLLAQHGADQRLRLNTAVTLDDLRQGPAVLIGALDNPWTLRALSHLRYQFGGSDEEAYWIMDTRDRQTHRLVAGPEDTHHVRHARLRDHCPHPRRRHRQTAGHRCRHRHERNRRGR